MEREATVVSAAKGVRAPALCWTADVRCEGCNSFEADIGRDLANLSNDVLKFDKIII